MTETKKIKKFNFSIELLPFFASGKFEVIAHPLPDDTRIVDFYLDEKLPIITLVLSSETFPESNGEIGFVTAPIIRRLS